MNYKTDEIEKTEEYLKIKDVVDNKVEKYAKTLDGGLGTCYKVWEYKKELLKSIYNIDWKSPAELNPNIIFD